MRFGYWSRFLVPEVLFAPDDGGGSGGAGGGDPPPTPSKTYTQVEFEEAVKKRLARQAKEHQKTIDDLNTKIATLEEKIKTTPPVDPNDPAAKDFNGRLELLESRHAREIDALKQELNTAKADRETEKKSRLEGERDRLITEALSKQQCRDSRAGKRIFLPQVEFDDIENRWMYRTNKNNLVEVEDGIAEEMPDYLKPPQMNGGGSGTGSVPPKAKAKAATLAAEEKKLADLKSAAQKNGAPTSAMVAFTKQQRKVEELKQELALIK